MSMKNIMTDEKIREVIEKADKEFYESLGKLSKNYRERFVPTIPPMRANHWKELFSPKHRPTQYPDSMKVDKPGNSAIPLDTDNAH